MVADPLVVDDDMVHPVHRARIRFAESVAIDLDQILRDLGIQVVQRLFVFFDPVQVSFARRRQRGIDFFEVLLRDAVHALRFLFHGRDRRHRRAEVLAAHDMDETASVKLVRTANDQFGKLDQKRRKREHDDRCADLQERVGVCELLRIVRRSGNALDQSEQVKPELRKQPQKQHADQAGKHVEQHMDTGGALGILGAAHRSDDRNQGAQKLVQ